MSDPESAAAPLPCDTCGRISSDTAWRSSWPFCPACAEPQFTGTQTAEHTQTSLPHLLTRLAAGPCSP